MSPAPNGPAGLLRCRVTLAVPADGAGRHGGPVAAIRGRAFAQEDGRGWRTLLHHDARAGNTRRELIDWLAAGLLRVVIALAARLRTAIAATRATAPGTPQS